MLGGLGIGDMKGSRRGREFFMQHRYQQALKSAFSELIRIQPDNLCGVRF
jgi:hypothetical protein